MASSEFSQSDMPPPLAMPADWMRALFEAIDDVVFVHDTEGRILEANPSACRRLGYTREELLSMTIRDIDAPEFAEGFLSRLHEQMNTGRFRCEGIHVTKGGERIAVDINTSAIQLGAHPGVLAVVRDISKKRREEESRARQSQLWQSVLDNMGEAVLATDETGKIRLTNPAAMRLFPTKLQPLFQAGENQAPLDQQPLARCIQGEAFDNLELYLPASPVLGNRWVSLTGRPLRDVAGTIRGGILVAHDITARKSAELHQRMQYAVATTLAASNTLQESAQKILRQMCEGLGFDLGVLWMVQAGESILEYLDGWCCPDLDLTEFMVLTRKSMLSQGLGLPGQVWLSGRAGWDAIQGPSDQFDRAGLAWLGGLRGSCAFPIHRGTKTIGVLEFFSRQLLDADEDLRALLNALGSQLGQVLERQRMEKALRDSETLYESLVESLPQNIFRKDREGRFIFANQRFCDTVRKSKSEILGRTDFELFPFDMASKYVQDDRHMLETGESLETIEEHRTPDGKRMFVQVVKTVVFNALGRIVGVQGIFWDVTEKKLAEEMVTHSERRYRQLTEATLDAIILADQEGMILLFNPAAERMFGYASAEIVGHPASLLASIDLRGRHEEGLARFVKSRETRMIGRTVEVPARRKDGSEFPVEIALSVLSLTDAGPRDGPIHFLAAIRDVTERNKMRSVLVQNEKLASIGLLSAGVAHEINNPLAFVSNNVVVLQRDCQGLLELIDLIDRHKESLAKIDPELAQAWHDKGEELDIVYVKENLNRLLDRTRDGVDRVTRIVQSLRGMARTDAPRRHDTNLVDLIDGSLEIIRGKYKRSGIEVIQDHPDLSRVSCVSPQISQVILNLLINAFQAVESFRPEGGIIWVRTRRVADEIVLEVQDNGPGISPEVLPRIFDPFFTTKDVGEGTGLGLSISHHIIAGHGGRIEVESHPGSGACFRVVFPNNLPRVAP